MLTPKQELFAQKIIEGCTQADAYRFAYSVENMSDNAIYVNASKVANNEKVKLRIQQLRDNMTKDSIMSIQERMEWLTDIINDNKTNINAKLAASDQMNKMQGAYIQKIAADVEVTKTTISIDLVDEEE